jgi:tetrahydromethanopterin S-methyltransferase subunit A
VVGSNAPEPIMPNLSADQLRAFQQRVTVVDMIDVTDAEVVVERARILGALPVPESVTPDQVQSSPAEPPGVEHVAATRDPIEEWIYDPVGYFLVFVDRAKRLLRVEQYTPQHRQLRVIEGASAEEICHTIVRLGQVTLLAHAAYLGRELAKAETALRLGLTYEQDRPLAGTVPHGADRQADTQGGA